MEKKRTVGLNHVFYTLGMVSCLLLFGCSDDGEDDSLLGDVSGPLTDDQVLIPHDSWACGMPMGIPAPQSGQLVFEAEGKLGESYDVGETPLGRRVLIEIAEGTVKGPNINAEFLSGGMDLQLTLSNGAMEVEQINALNTDDGVLIYVRSCGASPNSDSDVRMVMDFEAPNDSDYSFLNTGDFVSTRELNLDEKTFRMAVYEIARVSLDDGFVEMIEPEDVPDQSYECISSSGTPGEEVYTETVEIGSLLTVGESKNGTRNIIQITGGTVQGRIQGTIPAIGGDYQLLNDDGFKLDARYAIVTDDGEVILVRNCGFMGATIIPVFEASKDGNYAWINQNKWLSSDPESAEGGTAVRLTIYERNEFE